MKQGDTLVSIVANTQKASPLQNSGTGGPHFLDKKTFAWCSACPVNRLTVLAFVGQSCSGAAKAGQFGNAFITLLFVNGVKGLVLVKEFLAVFLQ